MEIPENQKKLLKLFQKNGKQLKNDLTKMNQ